MERGLLVISHGSRDAGWVALVDEAVDQVRERLGAQVAVEAAFLELVEDRLIQDGIDRLEAAGVTELLALPLFVSSGSTHVEEIGWALGAYEECRVETDLERFRVGAELVYGKPIDDAEELVDVLMDRLSELSVQPERELLLLIGHGSLEPGFREAWENGMDGLGAQLVRRGGFAASTYGMLMDKGQVSERLERLDQDYPGPEWDRIVIPLFLSEGYFTKDVIPARLAGWQVRYNGKALMPHPRIADWIVRQTLEWLETTQVQAQAQAQA